MPDVAILPTLTLPWYQKQGSEAWTDALIKDLSESQLLGKAPLGISEFMPSFWQHQGDRNKMIKFWANLIVMMASFESDWDPTEVYHEPAPLSVDSIGLLQLSVGDGGDYGLNPELYSSADLKDAVKNLNWAVQIADKLIKTDDLFSGLNSSGRWRGLGRYWSVMRPTNSDGSPRHSYYSIQSFTRQLTY